MRRLGFPGVEHRIADVADNAVRLATQIGYPVVVKPIDSKQGHGVTVGATSDDEVVAAFAAATAVSPGWVIVERFVEGEDHRLAVLGGRFAFAICRSPARVIADGEHTVAELIDIENQQRPEEQVDKGFLKKLKVDAGILAMLQKQELGLSDRVPAGQIIKLRSVANTSVGGTFVRVTDQVHPDNREMAEAIARCFRLDTAGIDLITPDITKSWRDVSCAVTEVNSMPALYADEDAQLIIERRFPGTSIGRVPSVVVVTTEPTQAKEVLPILQRQRLKVGFVEGALISLGGELRLIEHVSLAERVRALLLDPACEALVVACMQENIVREGFPLDRCDLCVIDPQAKLLEPVRTLLTQCSGRVVADAAIETALAQWLADVPSHLIG